MTSHCVAIFVSFARFRLKVVSLREAASASQLSDF